MIFVTGDTHIPHDINKLSTKKFPKQKELSKKDYVIICGDFGGVWEENNKSDLYWLKWLQNKNFTVDFVITHTSSLRLTKEFRIREYEKELNDFFEYLQDTLNYKKWFFGHFHDDIDLTDRDTMLYDKITQITQITE